MTCSLIGGLSNSVPLYIVSALILCVYFAMYSGTVESIVYDLVMEKPAPATCSRCALAGYASLRASPRSSAPWPADGWPSIAGKVRLSEPATMAAVVALMIATSVVLNVSGSLAAVIVAQVVLALLIVAVSIHVSNVLHDAVPSTIRAGVASGVSTISWMAFLPFALLFGWVTRQYGVHTSGWLITATTVLVGVLRVRTSLRRESAAADTEMPTRELVPVPAAC
jgi:hypothetical protein